MSSKSKIQSSKSFLSALASLALCLLAAAPAQSAPGNYTFVTLAGPPSPGWFDGTGAAARFNSPIGVATDQGGNIYAADTVNDTIRKITPSGDVSTLAGLAGSSGSANGTGSAARFNVPSGAAVDAAGNVYVADNASHTIRKVTPAGTVTTLAGSPGMPGSNDGTGSGARFKNPQTLAVDSAGNVYVADTGNSIIRKITPAGVVKTLAGTAGQTGTNDATGASARFNQPYGLTVDSAGNIFVADTINHTIRKITPAGVVTTLAGAPGKYGSADGTNGTARFKDPCGLAVDTNNNVYVADYYNDTIRKVTPGGVVTTLAGVAGSSGSADGTNGVARFNNPQAVATDVNGNVFVADVSNNTIRKVTPDGTVSTLAGIAGGSGSTDGTGYAARFNYPAGVSADNAGNSFVADFGNDTIRKIAPGGIVTTFAGSAGVTGTNDANGASARFNNPAGVAVDHNGTLYVVDYGNHAIREITPSGDVTTLAGLPGTSGTNDGTGFAALFNHPLGVAVDLSSNVFVSDFGNHTIRKISPAGEVSTLAGLARTSGTNDGPGEEARFTSPQGVAVDGNGNVFVADAGNHTIRKVSAAGVVSTLAGSPGQSGTTDGQGNAARFKNPFGIALDAAGNLFVSDNGNSTMRKITPAGLVSTIAGQAGKAGGTDGTGTAAGFNTPEGVAVDNNGNVYVADASNHSIRKGSPAPPDSPIVDFPIAGPGLTRQLDVTNLTTISWSWSVVRRPSGSSAQLSSASARNPTFSPDVPGLYTFQLEALDGAGHTALGTVSLTEDTAYHLLASTTGRGSVVPVSTNTVLTTGKIYTLTAKPATGYILSNWTTADGSVFSTAAILKFTAQNNFVLQANFVPNPFPPVTGNYAGLFSATNGAALASDGFFAATVTATGKFSAKLLVGGATYSLSGQLSAGGFYSNSIPRPGLSSLSVQVNVDLTGGNVLTGSVSDGTWTAPLAANRAVYSKTTNAPQALNKYTVVIPGSSDATQAPGGFGFATVSIDVAGNITFAGTLGDGTKVTQKAFVSQQNQWAFFSSLYSGHGFISGWLTFTNATGDIGGLVNWLKVAPAPGKLYPNGFNFAHGLEVAGALYAPTNGASSLGATNLSLILEGGNLAALTNTATLGANNKLTGPNKLAVTLTTASGLFSGSVNSPAGKAIPVSGVLLQNRNAGFGTFLGTNQSGSVLLTQ